MTHIYSASSSPHTHPSGLTSVPNAGRTVAAPPNPPPPPPPRPDLLETPAVEPFPTHPGCCMPRFLALEERTPPGPPPLLPDPCRELDSSVRNLEMFVARWACSSSFSFLLLPLPLLLALMVPAVVTLPLCFDNGRRFFAAFSSPPLLLLCQLSLLNHPPPAPPPPPPPAPVGGCWEDVSDALRVISLLAATGEAMEERRLPPLFLPTQPAVAGRGRATGWARCSPLGVVGSSLSFSLARGFWHSGWGGRAGERGRGRSKRGACFGGEIGQEWHGHKNSIPRGKLQQNMVQVCVALNLKGVPS